MEEGATDPKGARPRDGLGDGDLMICKQELLSALLCSASQAPTYPAILQRLAVLAIRQDGSMLCKVWVSSDGKVLFIVLCLDDGLFGLFRIGSKCELTTCQALSYF